MLWFALLKSGVHATLAGVITAFTIPALPKFEPGLFSQHMRSLLDKFDGSYKLGDNTMKNQQMGGLVQTMEDGINGVRTPLRRLEHSMHLPVAFFVLPIFALFNAGVALDFANFGSMLTNSITLGIVMGLVVGKFIGITGFSWLAVKSGFAVLPNGVTMTHIAGASLLAGIGFTMSIFIAELAYANQPEMIVQAKLGILLASLIAGIIGYSVLYKIGGLSITKNAQNEHVEKSSA